MNTTFEPPAFALLRVNTFAGVDPLQVFVEDVAMKVECVHQTTVFRDGAFPGRMPCTTAALTDVSQISVSFRFRLLSQPAYAVHPLQVSALPDVQLFTPRQSALGVVAAPRQWKSLHQVDDSTECFECQDLPLLSAVPQGDVSRSHQDNAVACVRIFVVVGHRKRAPYLSKQSLFAFGHAKKRWREPNALAAPNDAEKRVQNCLHTFVLQCRFPLRVRV